MLSRLDKTCLFWRGFMVSTPAVGVKLPRKRSVKPPVLLPLVEIRRVLEVVPEPTRSLLTRFRFDETRRGDGVAVGGLPARSHRR